LRDADQVDALFSNRFAAERFAFLNGRDKLAPLFRN